LLVTVRIVYGNVDLKVGELVRGQASCHFSSEIAIDLVLLGEEFLHFRIAGEPGAIGAEQMSEMPTIRPDAEV